MYYGFPDVDAKGVVAESECYKVFRSAQLVAYRQVLTATVMAEPEGISRASARMLDDMRERFGISDERHRIELALVTADPVVKAVQRSGVARERSRFEDPLGDVPVPAAISADAADDGGRVMQAPAKTSSKNSRPAPSPLPNQTARPQPPAEEVSAKQRSALEALTKQIEATSKQLLRTRDNGERVTLRMRLKDFDKKLDELLSG